MFVAEFSTHPDRDRVWEGSPWPVSKTVVILSDFEECMKPSKLKFDSIMLWARVLNLSFNLREKKWWIPIAQQIGKKAFVSEFDHVGG